MLLDSILMRFFNDNNYQFHEHFNVPFTMSELTSSVNSFKTGKASGPDGIFAGMIKIILHKIEIISTEYWKLDNFQQLCLKVCHVCYLNLVFLQIPNNYPGISLIRRLKKIIT